MNTFKTIFGEKLKVGDNIMYTTVRHNDVIHNFGIIEEMEPYQDQYFGDPDRIRLKVHKTYEMGYFRQGPEDVTVRLTNPRIIKCGQKLYEPKQEKICEWKENT